GLDRRGDGVARRVDVERFLALGVTRAGQELLAALVLADQQRLAALRAGVFAGDRLGPGRAPHRARGLAVGILGTTQERAGPAKLHHHGCPADVAGLAGGDLHPLRALRRRLERLLERVVELVE